VLSRRRPLVVYGDGPDGPLPDPRRLDAVRRLDDPELLLGWVVRAPTWLYEVSIPVTTVMTGAGLRAGVATGRVRAVHERLSSMPGLLAGRLRPDVAVVGAVADGRRWRSIGSVGWAPAAARAARRVVVERWPAWPLGAADPPPTPLIEGEVVEVVEREDPPDAPQEIRSTDIEESIATAVAGLVPDGATLQWGPGSIGAAVVGSVRRPVAVRSGLATPALAALADRGLLAGVAEAAYAWGGEALAALIAGRRLRLLPVGVTHDAGSLSSVRSFVAVNTALEVGLDGAVNVEQVGGRVVSGPGGHPDFCLAASRSPGGLSVIAARSTGAGGRPTLVAAPEVVSTPRTDVDVVVTEHGVADLRGLPDAARAAALLAVAGRPRG
jgi:acyl-CoA hydrolase